MIKNTSYPMQKKKRNRNFESQLTSQEVGYWQVLRWRLAQIIYTCFIYEISLTRNYNWFAFSFKSYDDT